ncbi:hypothetical protein VP01_11185g1, partial [Puccinia sorghi]
NKLVEVEARWRTFNTETLNIPPFQPKLMINHYKKMWISIFKLGSLILQTRVPDMDDKNECQMGQKFQSSYVVAPSRVH